jgi:HAD superfamily hydrolase (TIGR01490 family)
MLTVMAVAARALETTELRRTASGLAIFDLDRTVIEGSSLMLFARAAVRAGVLDRRLVARHLVAELRFRHRGLGGETLTRLTSRLLATAEGRSYAELAEVASARAPEIASRAYPAARDLLTRHRAAGDVTVLLSASPEPLVVEIGRALGVDIAIGTPLDVVDGRLTGRLGGRLCHGDGKVARLIEVIGDVDLATCTAYGDAESDLPLLRAVGTAVAVNADRRLAAAASAAGWSQLRFD